MFLFVGLGNIGVEYENTRHNIGFMCLDKILSRHLPMNRITKFKSEIFNVNIENNIVLFIKPQTFMNNSGVAVSMVKNFYKIPLENIFVFHDDLDLALGKIKFKNGGGDGGHNGIKSIDSMIGKNYYRIRVGIGRPLQKSQTVNYVLNKFTADEAEIVDETLKKITDNITLLFDANKNNFPSKTNL